MWQKTHKDLEPLRRTTDFFPQPFLFDPEKLTPARQAGVGWAYLYNGDMAWSNATGSTYHYQGGIPAPN